MKTKITSNILEDISRKLKGESYSEDMNNNVLVVFNGSNINLDQRIEYIKELKSQGIKISIAFSFMAEELLDTGRIINSLCPINIYREEDIFRLKDIAKNYYSIIGPNVTINTVSKVALGMIDSFIPTMIFTFLYEGKKTYLDFTSVRNYLGKETKNKVIADMTEDYIAKILKMGAIETKENNYSKEIVTKNNKNLEKSKTIIKNKEQKKVITERDIINLGRNESLILAKGSIITPLAKDKAKEMDIKIEIK